MPLYAGPSAAAAPALADPAALSAQESEEFFNLLRGLTPGRPQASPSAPQAIITTTRGALSPASPLARGGRLRATQRSAIRQGMVYALDRTQWAADIVDFLVQVRGPEPEARGLVARIEPRT